VEVKEVKRLKVSEKHKTKYCVPDWLRDEQIKLAIQRVKERIQPHAERTEPVAIVGYGPSLNDTWEEIRSFKYVVSCSGAHKFLVDRGIVPTWHVEVDPRSHKVALIGQPQQETEYLISSACHQKVFDHLEGFKVRIWHVYDPTDEGKRLLPPGEWAMTGGCDVGMRSMVIANFLGFSDMHCFGIDGSAREAKHAAEHPLGLKEGFAECEYPEGSGIIYNTTTGMLEAAKQIWHELDQLGDVRVTFYGDGLVQAMAKNYKKNAKRADFVAFAKPVLISEEYRALNVQLHRDNLAYGVGGGKHADTVLKLCERLKTTSVLDYGCGKGYLAKKLPFPIWEYDPAISGKDQAPRPADIVVCVDVLEHVEPDKIVLVLDDLRRCTRKVGWFVIHTGPSSKTLSDGRNAHLIQRPSAWWEKHMADFFEIGKVMESGPLLYFVVGPKPVRVSVKKSVKTSAPSVKAAA
jgi:hypothetical protein